MTTRVEPSEAMKVRLAALRAGKIPPVTPEEQTLHGQPRGK